MHYGRLNMIPKDIPSNPGVVNVTLFREMVLTVVTKNREG